MIRKMRRSVWLKLLGIGLMIAIAPWLDRIVFYAEAIYFVTSVLISVPITERSQFFYNDRLDRITIVHDFAPTPDEFDVTFSSGFGGAETRLVTIHSTILYGEVTWLGPHRLKLAFIVDPRASFDPPIAQVGAVRIDYAFIRGYEPPVWPYLVIERSR